MFFLYKIAFLIKRYQLRRKNIFLGRNVIIGRHSFMETFKTGVIFIGDGTNIGRFVTMSSIRKITIGKNCLIGYHVSFLDHDHQVFDPKLPPINGRLTPGKEIVIEDESFIGAHSFILKGVHLGKHCVVGANSVVTKSFSAYSVIAGNPAKLIKRIS